MNSISKVLKRQSLTCKSVRLAASDTLTHDQKRALEKLEAWDTWSAQTEPFGLFGAAGTGKTTVIGEWKRRLRGYRRVFFLAPTHKAAGVLSESVYPDQAMTIHRALGARQQIDSVTGKTHFEPAIPYEQPIAAADYVVVDECSMVNEELLGHLLRAQAIHGFKLIFMGDRNQLPSVERDRHIARESRAFEVCKEPHRIELKKVVRQQGALLQTVHSLRESMGQERLSLAQDIQDEQGLVRNWSDSAAFLEHFAERASEGARLVAYTNRNVDFVNSYVRRHLFPERHQEDYIPGELLVVTKSYEDLLGYFWHAEESLIVDRFKTENHPRYPLDVTRLHATDGRSLLVLTRAQERAWNRYQKQLSAKCKKSNRWGDLTKFKHSIGQVRPGWATTVHKSQGSTWQSVYVIQSDIMDCTDKLTRERLLYVAYSRAKHQLHVRV